MKFRPALDIATAKINDAYDDSLIFRPGRTGHRPHSWRKDMRHATSGKDESARPPLFHSPNRREGIALIVTTRRDYDFHEDADGEATLFGDRQPEDTAKWGLLVEGYAPSAIFVISQMPERPFEFRRNVQWADLPVISAPKYDFGLADIRSVAPSYFALGEDQEKRTSRTWEESRAEIAATHAHISRNIDRVERVHVIKRCPTELAFWHAIAPVVTRNPSVWVSVTENGNHRNVDRDEINALRQRCKADDHLMYNYVSNMAILASRAIFQAASESPKPRQHVMLGPKIHHLTEDDRLIRWDRFQLFTPLAIQLLIALAEDLGTPVDVRDGDDLVLKSDIENAWKDKYLRFHRGKTFKQSGWNLRWRGTGKYKEFDSRIASDEASRLTSALHWMCALAVVDGRLRITTFGRRVVDLLGSPARDPDILVRWRAEDGLFAQAEDMPAVDRWLVRHLRSVKRRMAPLAPHPLTEPGLPWENRSSNHLVVRGAKFELGEIDGKHREWLVERIIEANRGKPLKDTRIGIIFNEESLDPRSDPVAIWCGIPIAVVNSDYHARQEFNSSLRTEHLDDAIAVMVADWQDKLGVAATTLRFLNVTAEHAVENFVELESSFEKKRGSSFLALYHGYLIDDPDIISKTVKSIGRKLKEETERHVADRDRHASLINVRKLGPGLHYETAKILLIGKRIGVASINGISMGLEFKKQRMAVRLDVLPDQWNAPIELGHELLDLVKSRKPKLYAVGNRSLYAVSGDPMSGVVLADELT